MTRAAFHTFACLCIASCALARADGAVLWYDAPATDWEKEALPIGNGRMGAMVFGGIAAERLQFSEKSLWTGGPGAEGGYDHGLPAESRAARVRAIGRQLLDGATLEPEAVVRELGGTMLGYGDYQSFGDLVIEELGDEPAATDYRRELDLDAATARVAFRRGESQVRREYFASSPDQVLVARWSSDRPQRLRLRLAMPDNRSVTTRVDGSRITASGALHSNGLRFASALHVHSNCGSLTPDGDALRYEGACPVTLYLAARTNYRMEFPAYRSAVDPARAVQADVRAAASAGFDALQARHRADHRSLYRRVSLQLAAATPPMPTDRLRAQYGSGNAAADRALEQLYFDYGRYLLIASSRAGSLPANLQGVWNDKAKPPWNADYHVNINLQMNYWLAEPANLSETTAPLFDFVDHLTVPGARAARRYFDAPGWLLFLNTNAWGFVGPIDWPTAFWQPEAAAWLAQHYYEHYLFTRDEEFLKRRAWPVMKGAAEFWLAALVADPRDGRLVVSPSYSPEHGPFTAGAAMSQQIVADLLVNTSQAARRLGEGAFARRVDAALARLDRGLRVGRWGQLQEWTQDLDDPEDDHRHVSHLFALHPGRAIDPARDPALAAAARTTLDARGDASTGWSRAWKINFRARLRDGDRAHQLLAGLLRDSTLPNLWDTHPPFQIDGNFGAAAGMIEMLLQSQHGVIDVLPALPRAWSAGRIAGIRARGDVVVEISWDACGPVHLALESGAAGRLTVRSTLFEAQFTSSAPVAGDGAMRTLQAERNGRYVFRRVAKAGCAGE